MKIGMGVAGAWALAVSVADRCLDEAICLGASGMMVATGAGIGALIDYAIKGKTVVYRAKQGNVTATPVLLGSRGLGIAVRF